MDTSQPSSASASLRILLVLASLLSVAATSSSAHGATTGPTRISLPNGPASVEGLGRSFVPSLASGTASYGVDIAVPPAAGGFAPKLSLDYDGGSGASEVGLGFRISGLPSIRRRTTNGLPRFDATDAFELVGLGMPCDLLAMPDGFYRPQYESGSFARVKRSADETTWEVRAKDGTTYRFGGVGFTEEENGHVATYLLREAVDLHGHRIAYSWDTKSGFALLQAVVWNDFSKNVQQRIDVAYEARPDVHTLFSSGIRRVLDRRVITISVTLGGDPVRRYQLGYAASGRSLLTTVDVVGTDGVTALPQLSLGYTEPSFAAEGQVTRMAYPPYPSPADANVSLADLNGDSLPDLLVAQAGQFHTYVNHDGLTWKPANDWGPSTSPSLALSTIGVGLADLDGDGAIDLFAKSGADSFRYFPGKDATRFAAPVSIRTVPNFTFEDPDVRLADMDGDRLPDVAITTQAGLAVGYNLGGVDWSLPTPVGKIDARQELRFSDGKTELCDVNGDHVQDVCYLTPGSLAYWLGRGRGVFEAATEASGVPSFDASDPWKLIDLNGDGWVDLVHVGVNQVDYALATAEGSFGVLASVKSTPTKGPRVVVQFADMNGSGTTDILWIEKTDTAGTSWKYLELFPTGRAGLLQSIDNGLGKRTTITYASAASHAAAARDARQPWSSRINVAMPVVAQVQVDAQLGDPVLTTNYAYANGAWDPTERTFAGFGGGIQTDQGDDYTPTLVTESSFDTGLERRVLRGAVLTSEQRDASGRVFSRSTSSYTPRMLGKSSDGRSIEYAYKSDELVEHVEGAADADVRLTERSWEQDDFGNVTNESDWGEVTREDLAVGNDEAITLRTFANNVHDWVLGRLASEEATNIDGERVAMKRFYYDGKPFQGLPFGSVVRGDVARVDEWVGPGANAYELVSASSYDAHGNALEVHDGRGGSRAYTWDAQSFSRVIAEAVNTGSRTLQQRADYDPRFGAVETFTDFNGSQTFYEYDALGRLTAIVRPGDSRALPTKRYVYEIGAPLSRVKTEYRLESGAAQVASSLELVDGLGRQRATLAQEDDGRWVLGDVALLDTRGHSRRSSYPRYIPNATPSLAELQRSVPGDTSVRDALGREIEQRTQLGLVERTEYAPFVQRHWDGAQSVEDFGYEQTPTTQAFDGLGRLLKIAWVLNGAPVERTFTYDANGRVLTRRDPEGNLASFDYDGRGRLVSVDEPDAGRNTYALDAEGDVLERRHPDGVVTRYTYDLLGRPLSEDWDGDGNPEVVREYDLGGARFLGLLSKVTEPSGATAFNYDERERITTVHHTIADATYTVGARFDAQDRLVLHSYPDGSSVRLKRNRRGYLSGFGDDVVTFRYEADGREVRRDYATGISEQLTFDDDRRLQEQLVTNASGYELQHLRWTRDGAGNVTDIHDLRPHVVPERNLSAHYTFDNFYRLTGATGTWGATAWTYSPNGNITARASTVASENTGAFTYGDHAGPNALTGIGKRKLRYDARGRLTTDGDRTYSWNDVDRVTHVTNAAGASVDSVFDAQGDRRIRIETDARGQRHTTHFIDPWSEVRDGKLVRYLVHHDQRIIRLADDDTGAVPATKRSALTSGAGRSTSAGSSALTRILTTIGANFSQLALALTLLTALATAVARLLPRRRSARVVLAPALLFAAACAGTADDVDTLGSIRTLTHADEILLYDQLGSLTSSYRLDSTGTPSTPTGAAATFPYGTPRFDTGVRETRQFANAPRDTSIGVDIMGARAYVPELGVWASPDPALLDDPREYLRSHPSHSAYTYANSNPVTLRDDNGEFAILVAAAVFIGVTFAPAKLDAPQTRAQLAAEMAKLTVKTYATLSMVRAVGTALVQGPRAAAQFAGQAVTGTAIATTVAPVKQKIVEKATAVNPVLGVATEVALDVAPGMLRGLGPRKVAGGPKAGTGRADVILHPSQRAARRAAEREAGMGKNGPRQRLPDQPLNRWSRAPQGPPGTRTETKSPETGRVVHHDPYGNHYPDDPAQDVGPHYGVEGPGISGATHHTYPSTHDPKNNR